MKVKAVILAGTLSGAIVKHTRVLIEKFCRFPVSRTASPDAHPVMPGLVPGISHRAGAARKVDGLNRSGRDGGSVELEGLHTPIEVVRTWKRDARGGVTFTVSLALTVLLLLAVGASEASGQTPPPKTAEEAIADERTEGQDFGLGGSDPLGEYDLQIVRPTRGAPRFTLDVKSDEQDAPDYFTVDAMVDGSGGHRGAHLSRSHDPDGDGNTLRERVFVYTDIDAPLRTGFADSVLQVDASAMSIPTFGPGYLGTIARHVLSPGDSVEGTYRGARGQYRCSGTDDCTVRVGFRIDDSYAYRNLTGDWIFVPDVRSDGEYRDGDYYRYGAWLKTTENAAGTILSHDEVETFYGSSLMPTGDVSAVTGHAMYYGGAAGVYAKNGMSGHFTAEAELAADFDNSEISGYIYNFKLDGMSARGWEVDLWPGEFSKSDGTFSGDTSTLTNSVAGGDGDGSYQGGFYGEAKEWSLETDAPPPQILGEFNATFLDGSAAGAFGARTRPRVKSLAEAIEEVNLPPLWEIGDLTRPGIGPGIGGRGAPGTDYGAPGEYHLDITRDGQWAEIDLRVTTGEKVSWNNHVTDDFDWSTYISSPASGHAGQEFRLIREPGMDGSTVDEIVRIFTDIENPTKGTFTDRYELDVRPKNEEFTAYQLDPAADLLLVSAREWVPGDPNGHQIIYPILSGDRQRVQGFFDGAQGRFTCVGGTACAVTVNPGTDTLGRTVAQVTAIEGRVAFIPKRDAEWSEADADYLSYGVWARQTTLPDGRVHYNELQPFADSTAATIRDITAVTGSATYRGGAAGVYARDGIGGTFEARSELTANFDTNRITGSISDVQLSEEHEGGAWSVRLNDGQIFTQGQFTGRTDGLVDGVKASVHQDDQNAYSGRFHGLATAGDQPSSATGEFIANFSNGAVAGALGTNKRD